MQRFGGGEPGQTCGLQWLSETGWLKAAAAGLTRSTDIVDYVLKITHRIWEEKGIGVIYDTYHNDVTMHCASSIWLELRMWLQIRWWPCIHFRPPSDWRTGNLVKTWYKGISFLPQGLSTATNLGDSDFGKATGKRLISHCHWLSIENNRIYEEAGKGQFGIGKAAMGFDVQRLRNMARGKG